jgi:fused signal recognition particle receptor
MTDTHRPDDTPEAPETEPGADLELSPESKFLEEDRPKKNFWGKLKRGLFMTHTEIIDKMSGALEGKSSLDQDTIEYLEEILIGADLGVETALELVERVRADLRQEQTADIFRVREALVDEMSILLMDAPKPPPRSGAPLVTLVVGVNGVGKTTSIAKLARRAQLDGERVILAAGDTFRAAAIEQLQLWGRRLNLEVIAQTAGSDPAAVVFDALQAAKARKADQVFVDTAGRLHNKEHLMRELAKIGRVIDRETDGWDRRTLLVLDATTGQNAIQQARAFAEVVNVDGVLLSKLDGTAKGGMAVAVARDLRLPVLYLGVGETPEDLVPFYPRDFASALLG